MPEPITITSNEKDGEVLKLGNIGTGNTKN
jgi:hypothetical protein